MYRCPKLPENTRFTASPVKPPNAPPNTLEAPNHLAPENPLIGATVVRVLITAFTKPFVRMVDGIIGKCPP